VVQRKRKDRRQPGVQRARAEVWGQLLAAQILPAADAYDPMPRARTYRVAPPPNHPPRQLPAHAGTPLKPARAEALPRPTDEAPPGALADRHDDQFAQSLRAIVEDFVWRLTGKETIYQMMELADHVQRRGGKALDPLEMVLMIICGLTLFGFSVSVCCDIMTRQLGDPWLWLQEVTSTLFVYGIFIGASVATRWLARVAR